MLRRTMPVAVLMLALVVPCTGASAVSGTPDGGETPPRVGPDAPGSKPEEKEATIVLSSPTIIPGEQMPKKYTVDGEDVSPPLKWDATPEGTKEFVIIMADPTVRRPGGWTHWVIYGIPPQTRELPENLPREPELAAPVAARQGQTSWRTVGYRGPAGGKGRTHEYHFTIYALDTRLGLPAGATAEEVRKAMEGHVLATGKLVGTNTR